MFRDIDPKAALSTYRRCALDSEAECDGVLSLGCKVDIFASDIWCAIVLEGQHVDLVRSHGFGSHDIAVTSSTLRRLAGQDSEDAPRTISRRIKLPIYAQALRDTGEVTKARKQVHLGV